MVKVLHSTCIKLYIQVSAIVIVPGSKLSHGTLDNLQNPSKLKFRDKLFKNMLEIEKIWSVFSTP